MLLFVGTYTRRGAEGIYTLSLDPATGDLQPVGLTRGIPDPAFLDISPDGRHLYSVSEVVEFDGKKTGALYAYAIDPQTHELAFINAESSGAPGPCHVSVDPTNRTVLAANYTGGSAIAFPIREDGGLGPLQSLIQHEGNSINPDRQEAPHAHSIKPSPDNRFAFCPDLGTDKVMVYRFDAASATLTPNDPAFAPIEPGHGPRHLSFHPNGRFLYVINELGSSISAFTYRAETGTLEPIHRVSTLPEDYRGHSTCADIHVHPSGKFLYGSNRGHDSIAIFSLDSESGRLTPIGHETRDCSTPRNFALDPAGEFLLVGNQDRDLISTFRIDPESGLLEHTNHLTPVPAPVCLKFLPQG